MAEVLKRQYDLLALRLAMDLSAESPQVSLRLEGRSEGQLTLLNDWTSPAHSIGLPARLDRSGTTYRGYPFYFPDDVLDGLKNVIVESEYQNRPLWLHLAKPLGYLNLVPWEQLLQPKLRMPILRLPDFVANPPRESPERLEVALCGSEPVAKAAFKAVDHLVGIAGLIIDTVPRRATVHIFCDAQLFPYVRNRVEGMGSPEIHVLNPADAESFSPAERQFSLSDQPSRVQNPWLRWMRHALRGRSIDLVHFVTHGYLSRDSGALAFAESPLENLDRRIARFVGASELLAFFTQVGAWSAAFSSPERNYSEMGLRVLADTIAQMRPGPVLHHEMRLDRGGSALAEAYHFLFGKGGIESPSSPALFTYCHPSLLELRESAARPVGRAMRGAKAPAPKPEDVISDVYEAAEQVPSWVGASQRYLEQRRRDLQEVAGRDEAMSELSYKQWSKDAKTIEDTLKQIEDTLGKVLATNHVGEK